MTKKTPGIASVSLPAGSYDLGKLSDGLDKAAGEKDDGKQQEAIGKAIDKAATRLSDDARPAGARPDQKVVEVKNEALGVTESVRVHNPKSDEAAEAEASAEETAKRQAAQQKQRAEAVGATSKS